uniref:VHS domain-containing protein n=1 Tax=Athene cunicularia TaxID=194338 RepID=A0A663LSF5_ATHCN
GRILQEPEIVQLVEHRSLNKATNPSNRQEDWEYIIGFCDQINKELEGPQIAVRLLAHKIQSPQEWEAVQALTVGSPYPSS